MARFDSASLSGHLTRVALLTCRLPNLKLALQLVLREGPVFLSTSRTRGFRRNVPLGFSVTRLIIAAVPLTAGRQACGEREPKLVYLSIRKPRSNVFKRLSSLLTAGLREKCQGEIAKEVCVGADDRGLMARSGFSHNSIGGVALVFNTTTPPTPTLWGPGMTDRPLTEAVAVRPDQLNEWTGVRMVATDGETLSTVSTAQTVSSMKPRA
jgi:hypothetical protein